MMQEEKLRAKQSKLAAQAAGGAASPAVLTPSRCWQCASSADSWSCLMTGWAWLLMTHGRSRLWPIKPLLFTHKSKLRRPLRDSVVPSATSAALSPQGRPQLPRPPRVPQRHRARR